MELKPDISKIKYKSKKNVFDSSSLNRVKFNNINYSFFLIYSP